MGGYDMTGYLQQSFLGPGATERPNYGPMGIEGSTLEGQKTDPSKPITVTGGFAKKHSDGRILDLQGNPVKPAGTKVEGKDGYTIAGYESVPNDPFGLVTQKVTFSPEQRAQNALDYYNSVAAAPMDFAGTNVSFANTAATYYNDPATQKAISDANAPAPIAPPIVDNSAGDIKNRKAGGLKVKRPPATILNSTKYQGKNLTGN